MIEPLEGRVLLAVQTSVNVAMIGSSGSINGGYLPVSGTDVAGVTFTNLAPASVDAAGLAPFDTAVLHVASAEMAGNVNTLSAASKAALVDFVGSGHKLIIWDSETTSQDYSWLPFPFTTSNPGQRGANGVLTDVEENTLSSTDQTSAYYIDTAAIGSQTDAIGDANVMTTFDPNWKIDMVAQNTLGVTGPVQTYAEYSNAPKQLGLIIYCGMDEDSMYSAPFNTGLGAQMLRKIYVQEIRQQWDPSDLPGSVPVVGIALSPLDNSGPGGSGNSATLTATLTDQLGKPQADIAVTFTVFSGPNVGKTSTVNSDATGVATFKYADTGGLGVDTIEATFVNAKGETIHSKQATQTWTYAPGVTVLVHGYAGGDAISYWGIDNIAALLNSVGGGLVYRCEPTTGAFERVNDPKFLTNPSGEVVLVDDWSAQSTNDQGGQAEAAADALFAALVNGGYINPQTGFSKHLHFVGHSRGCSVVSEVVQRIGYYGINVDYVTYLDSHDYAERNVPFDDEFHDPATQVWTNVLYQDNFWEQNGLPAVPSGRDLEQMKSPDGYEFDYELTSLTGFGDSFDVRPGHNPHSKVVDWYFGTVTPGSAPDSAKWYLDGKGADNGFSLWRSLGGNGANNIGSRLTSIPRANPQTMVGIRDYYGAGEPHEDDNQASVTFFDGDFDLPDLLDVNLHLPGWSYDGGAGNATLAMPLKKSGYLQLDSDTPFKTHNRMYFPPSAQTLSFDLAVKKFTRFFIGSATLEVYATDSSGNVTQLGSKMELDKKAKDYTRTAVPIPEKLRGQVGTLTFKVATTFGAFVGIGIDNIDFDNSGLTALPHATAAAQQQPRVAISEIALAHPDESAARDDLAALLV